MTTSKTERGRTRLASKEKCKLGANGEDEYPCEAGQDPSGASGLKQACKNVPDVNRCSKTRQAGNHPKSFFGPGSGRSRGGCSKLFIFKDLGASSGISPNVSVQQISLFPRLNRREKYLDENNVNGYPLY